MQGPFSPRSPALACAPVKTLLIYRPEKAFKMRLKRTTAYPCRHVYAPNKHAHPRAPHGAQASPCPVTRSGPPRTRGTACPRAPTEAKRGSAGGAHPCLVSAPPAAPLQHACLMAPVSGAHAYRVGGRLGGRGRGRLGGTARRAAGHGAGYAVWWFKGFVGGTGPKSGRVGRPPKKYDIEATKLIIRFYTIY